MPVEVRPGSGSAALELLMQVVQVRVRVFGDEGRDCGVSVDDLRRGWLAVALIQVLGVGLRYALAGAGDEVEDSRTTGSDLAYVRAEAGVLLTPVVVRAQRFGARWDESNVAGVAGRTPGCDNGMHKVGCAMDSEVVHAVSFGWANRRHAGAQSDTGRWAVAVLGSG